MQLKRVLALVPEAFGGFGGIAVYNVDLLHALSESSKVDKVTVLPRLVRSEPTGVPGNIDFQVGAAGGSCAYLAQLLSQSFKSFNLVLCTHLNLLPLAVVASRKSRCRLATVLYGFEAWAPSGRPFTSRAIKNSDRFISISQFTADEFSAWAAIPNERVSILPNCVHLDRMQPNPKPLHLIERYGLQGSKVLFTLGRMPSQERQKGIEEVMAIMPDLIRAIPTLKFLIGGDGDDSARLKKLAVDRGIGTHVVFAGRVPEHEKADHFRLADAFTMVGRQEGFGFVFLEAMACGTPVVASSKDGSREAVRDGALGELADPDDLRSLTAAILRALDKPRHVPAGLDHFSFDQFRQRLDTIIDDTFARPRI